MRLVALIGTGAFGVLLGLFMMASALKHEQISAKPKITVVLEEAGDRIYQIDDGIVHCYAITSESAQLQGYAVSCVK